MVQLEISLSLARLRMCARVHSHTFAFAEQTYSKSHRLVWSVVALLCDETMHGGERSVPQALCESVGVLPEDVLRDAFFVAT